MNWKLYAVAGSVLAAGLSATGWAVNASAEVSSPDLGPPVVVRPTPQDDPPQPAETPDEGQPPARTPGAPASRAPSAGPPAGRGRQPNPPEAIPPRWIEPPVAGDVRPPQDDEDQDEGEDEDEDSTEADDD